MSMEETLKEADRFIGMKDALGAERVLEAAWPNINTAPAEVQHTWANVRVLQGRYPEAEQLLRNAARLEPESQRHAIALGHLLVTTGNHKGAAEAYAAAMRLDRDWPGLAGVYALATYRSGNFAEAEKAARYWIEKAPSAEAWDTLSGALREQGKGAEALAAADEALRVDPRNNGAHNSRAAALLKLGRPQDALEVLNGLIANGVSAPAIYLNRGKALEAMKRQAEAAANYADGASRFPGDRALQQAAASSRR